jgi:gas vesicle protein
MNSTVKMILGITVAAAAGAAIGMLLAPEKGSDLQKKIKEGASDWMHEFTGLLGMGKQLVSEFRSINPDMLTSEMIDMDESQKTNYPNATHGSKTK